VNDKKLDYRNFSFNDFLNPEKNTSFILPPSVLVFLSLDLNFLNVINFFMKGEFVTELPTEFTELHDLFKRLKDTFMNQMPTMLQSTMPTLLQSGMQLIPILKSTMKQSGINIDNLPTLLQNAMAQSSKDGSTINLQTLVQNAITQSGVNISKMKLPTIVQDAITKSGINIDKINQPGDQPNKNKTELLQERINKLKERTGTPTDTDTDTTSKSKNQMKKELKKLIKQDNKSNNAQNVMNEKEQKLKKEQEMINKQKLIGKINQLNKSTDTPTDTDMSSKSNRQLKKEFRKLINQDKPTGVQNTMNQKEQELKIKKEQELKIKKEQELRIKKEQELRNKIEMRIKKEQEKKKEQDLRIKKEQEMKNKTINTQPGKPYKSPYRK
jgi:hypothetical protein